MCLSELLENLDVLSSRDDVDYTEMEEPVITAITKAAARINGVSLPFSQLRCDSVGNIYLINWLYKKEFEP